MNSEPNDSTAERAARILADKLKSETRRAEVDVDERVFLLGSFVLACMFMDDINEDRLEDHATNILAESGAYPEGIEAFRQYLSRLDIIEEIVSLRFVPEGFELPGMVRSRSGVTLDETEFIRGVCESG